MKEQDIDLIYSPPVKVTLSLSVTPEMLSMLVHLGDELQMPKETMIRKAIALLKTAVDARKEGLQLALVDEGNRVCSWVVGIWNKAP
jgi:hypothetical protein